MTTNVKVPKLPKRHRPRRSDALDNLNTIQEAIIKLEAEGKRLTRSALATYTGLSRKTVSKHLSEN